MAQAQRTVIA
jgi:hypothetical protein